MNLVAGGWNAREGGRDGAVEGEEALPGGGYAGPHHRPLVSLLIILASCHIKSSHAYRSITKKKRCCIDEILYLSI